MWITDFLNVFATVATYGNNRQTRVLVLSDQDQRKNIEKLRNNEIEKANKIIFEQEPLAGTGWDGKGQIKGENYDEEMMMMKLRQHKPTVLVIVMAEALRRALVDLLERYQFIQYNPLLPSTPDYLIAEARDIWHSEDCILTCTTVATGGGLMKTLKDLVTQKKLNSDKDKIVVISGGHGSNEKNVDGKQIKTPYNAVSCFSCEPELFKDFLENKFYREDCSALKVKPHPDPIGYKIVDGKQIPHFIKSVDTPEPSYTKTTAGGLENLDVCILNIAHYHATLKNLDLLIKHLYKLQPTHLVIAWCFSINDDLACALRSTGFFSIMLIEFDLRRVTGKPDLKLDDEQVELIMKWSQHTFRNFIVCGGPGTGKTILACQALLITLSQLWREGKKVKLFIATWGYDDLLREKFRTHYLSTAGLEEENITDMRTLCEQLNVENELSNPQATPQATINEVTAALSARHTECETVLLLDEVMPCSSEAEPDWRDIQTRPRVHCFIALQPRGNYYDKPVNILLPNRSDTLARRLLVGHRNSAPIRAFIRQYVAQHETEGYINLDDDVVLEDSELPSGPKPFWLDCPENTKQVEILERVAKMKEAKQFTEITVIYNDIDSEAETWCEDKGWPCHWYGDSPGCEWPACLVLDCLTTETISRAANLLVLVTTERDQADKFRPAVFRDLLDRRLWPGLEPVREENSEESSSDSE